MKSSLMMALLVTATSACTVVPTGPGSVATGGGSGTSSGIGTTSATGGLLPQGSMCVDGVDCATGLCADGFCCNLACTGVCEACSAAETGVANGQCAPAPGAACPGSCDDGIETAAGTCNASGVCIGATTECSPYTCGDSACNTSCKLDGDCNAANFCWTSQCVHLTGLSTAIDHTCAVTSAGGVQCWGGAFGNGAASPSGIPIAVSGLSASALAVSGGHGHACAVTSAGAVQCWGYNNSGQLGNNSTTDSPMPVMVSGLSSGAAAVASGDSHACALTTVGSVYCWGRNTDGQLGDNSTVDSLVPVPVTGLGSGVTAIALGDNYGCAVTSLGGVKCWGANGGYQLGNDAVSHSLVPVAVTGLSSSISDVVAGSLHTCALTSGGGVLCWGFNGEGQLGNDSTTSSPTPVAVMGLSSGVIAIAAGGMHTCANTTAQGMKCWGSNSKGELGNGSFTDSYVPVDVARLSSGVVAISAASGSTCMLGASGRVKCWGWNEFGQLGNNSMVDSPVPVDVLEP